MFKKKIFKIIIFFIVFILTNTNKNYLYACNLSKNFEEIEKELLNNNNELVIKLIFKLNKFNNKCNFIKLLIKLTYFFAINDYNNSNKLSNKFINLYNSNNKFYKYVLYIKALSNLNIDRDKFKKFIFLNIMDKDINNIKISFNCFKKICEQKNNNIYYNISFKKMNELKDRILNYEIYIISYYYNKSLYISVINRLIYLKKKFPEYNLYIDKFLEETNKKFNLFLIKN